MSGLLLDTNALLWLLSDDPRLEERARRRITGAPGWFSAVSILEVTIKVMLGRLHVPQPVAQAARAAGLQEMAFTAAHAQGLTRFPAMARHDPFDRMLLAQADAEERWLLTADRALLGLGLDLVIDARE